MREVWRAVKGYKGLYQVSNLGRIRSIHLNKKYEREYFILSPWRNAQGYEMVYLCRSGTRKKTFVHRIVAEAFIPNPNHLPFINHKNWITHDNRVENLEWCDASYNNKYRRKYMKEGINTDEVE